MENLLPVCSRKIKQFLPACLVGKWTRHSYTIHWFFFYRLPGSRVATIPFLYNHHRRLLLRTFTAQNTRLWQITHQCTTLTPPLRLQANFKAPRSERSKFSNSHNTAVGDRIFKSVQHRWRRPYFHIHTTPLTETVFSNPYNTTYGTVFENPYNTTVFSHSYDAAHGDRIFKFIQHHLRNRIWNPYNTASEPVFSHS